MVKLEYRNQNILLKIMVYIHLISDFYNFIIFQTILGSVLKPLWKRVVEQVSSTNATTQWMIIYYTL